MDQLNLKILNVEEFAELLGVQTNSVYKWHCKNELPEKIFRKVGRKLIFIASEVESWIVEDRCQLVREKKERKNENNKRK